MAELSFSSDKAGGCPEMSHTFVIEIDRKGSQVQERLRWKWPQSQNSTSAIGDTTTAVAQALLNFLETHLLALEPMGLAETVDSSARASLKDQLPRGYSVEVHQPALGGWSPLSTATPSETIPRNCRVHVSVNEKPTAVPPQQQNMAPSSSASGGIAGALPSLPPEQTYETDGGEMLALPWRRFDQDLGGGGGEGLQICGRRVVVGDVSNSSEGTGLFTWDGSLLLAKYLEHQGIAMRRDFDNQRSRRQTRPTSPASERAEGVAGATNTTGGRTESCSKRSRPVVRVLELGCGTGLAGLAAAFSFGRAESGDSDNESRGAPPRPPRRSDTCEGEHHGSVECVSSSVVEDGAEVVLTDLEYALENARGNINHNASSLEAIGSTVKAVELDWCRPLPDEFAGGDSFDLILAADVVWLDELVEPLVRTLERLTAGWPSCSGSDAREQQSLQARPAALSVPSAVAQERGLFGESAATTHANGFSQKCQGAVVASPPQGSPRLQRPRVGQRVLLAYQWRSQRTGDALLEELETAFRVREIQPELLKTVTTSMLPARHTPARPRSTTPRLLAARTYGTRGGSAGGRAKHLRHAEEATGKGNVKLGVLRHMWVSL